MNYPDLPKWQLVALPATLIMLSIFYFSKYFVADELIYANYQVRALKSDLQTALERLETEKSRSAIAEREADVVRRANALLRASERERQDEITSLRADLAFYRRLGAANGSQAPLAVHHVELESTQSPRVFRIIFTLTQKLRWAAVISGKIELGVDGIQHGVAQHLTQQQLLAESSDPLNFQFKYFQQFERLITLPEDFEANKLTIRLRPKNLRTPIEQSMGWQDVFNQQTSDNTENKAVLDEPDD